MRTRVEHQVSRHDDVPRFNGRKSDNTQVLAGLGKVL